MNRLCNMMGLEVLPETEAILGDKLDQTWDDTWPELRTLSEHVRARSKAMFGYLKMRRDRSHKEALEELRREGKIPVLDERDRAVAEKALEEASKQMAEAPRSTGTTSGADVGHGSGAGAGAGQRPSHSAGRRTDPAPASSKNVQLTDQQRALLMEDRSNVFYEWQNEETYDEISWKDMQAMVAHFVTIYQAQRLRSPELSDDDIRNKLLENADTCAKSKRFPMMFRLCTSRTSDRKVFEGFRKIIAGRKAIQEGIIPEHEVYPRVFHELAELFKLDRQLTEEERERAHTLPSVEHALAMGAAGVDAVSTLGTTTRQSR